MSLDFIKYAFVAGEISPTFLGRTDLEKYDLGLALARNYFVDYRGGLSTRPGTEFIDFIQHDNEETKFFKFQFAPNLANTYVLLFGRDYIRFIQDGAYVLEGDVTITGISQSNPGQITAPAHGLAAGDIFYVSEVVGMTEINGRLLQAYAVGTNTIDLYDPLDNTFNTIPFGAYVSGGVISRVYTVASPYLPEELADLRAVQRRDYVRLTHASHPIRNLIRSGHTSWALTDESIGSGSTAPVIASGAGSAGGAASVGFIVTAVIDGEESLPSDMLIISAIVDYTSTAGSASIVWGAVAGAQYYNVYRTRVQNGAGTGLDIFKGDEVGYVGRSYAPQFNDNNIVPDFTITPPAFRNPFANGAIESIAMTATGGSYVKTDTVVITDPTGTGFSGFPIVNDAGAIVAVVVVRGGKNYTAPVVSFVSGGGSLAMAIATVSELTGNDPAISAVFQQRQMYGASLNQPLTIWGGRPGLFSNFDESQLQSAGDSLEFELDSEEVAPLLHLITVRSGLLIVSQTGVWLLRSGNTNEAITPTEALADPQSYRGCSSLVPLSIDTDILYVEGKSPTVRLLAYNDAAKVFGGQDMSILSNHLFDADRRITHWAYAQNPHNLVFARRSDGALLLFTLVKEQDVYAWTQCYTKGLVEDVISIQENGLDRVYLVAKRHLNGRWTKCIERFAPRTFEDVEQAFCVDCGLELAHTYPVAELTPGAATGTGVTFATDLAVFVAGDVGSVIRGGGGKAIITGYVDPTHVVADIRRDFTKVLPEDEDDTALPISSGEWTLDAPVTELTALHLANQPVAVLADGSVVPNLTADADGVITLPNAASQVVVGLGFRCVAQTLPTSARDSVIEAKRKNIKAIAVRINETRGLKAGASLDDLFELKERTEEYSGEPVALQNGIRPLNVLTGWDEDASVFYVQDYPLPATILGYVSSMEVGDDDH